jgi:hypothetical protein
MTMLRIVLILNVLTILLQALFAGRMLGGDDQSANLHEFTAKALVLLTASQIVLGILLKAQKRLSHMGSGRRWSAPCC